MARVLVTYYSRSGNTKAMAQAFQEGAASVDGIESVCLPVDEVQVKDLLSYDAIIAGSPTYYGLPAAEIVKLFNESVAIHGRLSGKVGAAFSSSGNIGGGNETTAMGILEMMLVHGMVVVGTAQGDHYGPVSIGSPDEKALEQCRVHGKKVSELALKLA